MVSATSGADVKVSDDGTKELTLSDMVTVMAPADKKLNFSKATSYTANKVEFSAPEKSSAETVAEGVKLNLNEGNEFDYKSNEGGFKIDDKKITTDDDELKSITEDEKFIKIDDIENEKYMTVDFTNGIKINPEEDNDADIASICQMELRRRRLHAA